MHKYNAREPVLTNKDMNVWSNVRLTVILFVIIYVYYIY